MRFQGPLRTAFRYLNDHFFAYLTFRPLVLVALDNDSPPGDVVVGFGMMTNVKPHSGYDGTPYEGVDGEPCVLSVQWEKKETPVGHTRSIHWGARTLV